MKKNKQFENMTFEEIYSFMNSNLTNNITNVLKYCVTAGCLLFPMYFMKKLNVPESVINNMATGATLAGVGCTGFVGQAIQDVRGLFVKPDNKQQYIQCQMVHYMVFFSAIIETITEIEIGDNNDWIEEFKEELRNKRQSEDEIEDNLLVESMFDIKLQIQEVKENMEEILSEFEKHFFELEFWTDLGDSEEEQRTYFKTVFRDLPDKALKIYKSQITMLCSDFPAFKAYFCNEEMYGMDSKIQKMTDVLRKLDKKTTCLDFHEKIFKRELFYREKEKYYTFFGDGICSVNNLFFMDIYSISKVPASDYKETDINLEKIMDIVNWEKVILVTGPYGSGKTVLLKKLYYRYSRYGETVLAFDAIDLLEILQEGEDEFIQFFEEISQDRNTVFLIDGLDDLNIENKIGSENTWLDIFFIDMYKILERTENISFVLGSRLYSRTREEETDVAERMYIYTDRGRKEIYIVNTELFKADTVSKWIDQFVKLHNCAPIDKSSIKKENGKIISALSNPLFLYVFMNKYLEDQSIMPKEGFYYYYDIFIEQTIKGKFYLEGKLGAKVIENYTDNYRKLLQEVAFDILKKHNEEITSTIIREKMNDSEPLLGEELQSSKYIITIDDFSEVTKKYYEDIKNIEIYDMANLINCYFFRMVNNKVFFTDSNILFTLAAERIYGKLFEIVQKATAFSVEDLKYLDVIDFYPQILDYIIYKIRNNKKYFDEFKSYARSFVTNKAVQNRLLPIRYNPEEAIEDLAQIVMMYIIFFKLNKESFAQREYQHIFKEFIWYVNTYKTIKYNCNDKDKEDYIYTVERYFMEIYLSNLELKRINLKKFNFQNSNLCDLKFIQCKMENVRFNAAKLRNNVLMSLCNIKKCNFMFDNTWKNTLELTDCRIDGLSMKPRKVRLLRCYINDLCLNLEDMELMEFEECVINKLIFVKGVSKTADACIEFRNCDFKTNIMLDGVRVSIKLKGKSLYLGKGSVFKNITCPNKIENIDKIEKNKVIPKADNEEISVFCEMHIKMEYQEEMLPHFQVLYNKKQALIGINNHQIIEGKIPEEQSCLVSAWCIIHKDELMENWILSREMKKLNQIAPLL